MYKNPLRRSHLQRVVVRYIGMFAMIALSGCANQTSVSSTWHDPTQRGVRYDKVLVIALAEDEDKRQSFEDALARGLSSASTTATPSTRVMDMSAPIDRENIAPAVRATGAKAVIVTEVTSFEVKPIEIKGYTDVSARRQKGSPITYDYVEKELPSFITTEFTTILTTDVYDAATDAYIYTLVSSATGQETLNDVINVLSDVIAKRLRSDKVIR